MSQSRVEFVNDIYERSDHLHKSVANAILGKGKLPDSILELEGMSSRGIRLLLNNLCDEPTNYLEIGSWKGSTFISALYQNMNVRGVSIDFHEEYKDHSFLETTPAILKENCEKYLVAGEVYTLITKDCFKIKLEGKNQFTTYLYDGGHSYEDQYKALTHYYDNLQDIFYYICDDYNTCDVEKGTQDAIRDLNIQVISEFKLFGNQAIHHSRVHGFWNGYYVALCVKKNAFPEFFKEGEFAQWFPYSHTTS
jgi:hypothetical protein